MLFYEGTLTDITAAHELSQQLSYDAIARPADGPGEPSRVRAAAAACARDDAGDRCDARGAVSRSRPVQERQRHLRSRRGRRAAAAARPKCCSRRCAPATSSRASAATSSPCCCTTAGRKIAMQVANNLLKAVDEFAVRLGREHLHARRQHRAGRDRPQLQAHRAGHERSRHRLLRRQGRRAQPHRRASRRTRRWSNGATAKWSGSPAPSVRSTENRLFLDAQLILPLDKRATAASATALRAARAHARRIRALGAARARSCRRSSATTCRCATTTGSSWRALQWIVAAIRTRTAPRRRFFINLSRDTVVDRRHGGVHPAERSRGRRRSDARRIRGDGEHRDRQSGTANQLITELRRMGCTFGLDDFGSGVSSFAYLKALGRRLPQDRRHVRRQHLAGPVDYAMVRSIKDIGHVMGKQVDRGVASRPTAVLDKLREIGVDYAQGFRGQRAATARRARPASTSPTVT